MRRMGQEDLEIQHSVDMVLPQCYTSGMINSPESSPRIYGDGFKIFSLAQGLTEGKVESPSIMISTGGHCTIGARGNRKEDNNNPQGTEETGKVLDHQQLILQAQMLLTKNMLYQKIGQARQQLVVFPSAIYGSLPRTADADRSNSAMSTTVTSLHRDATVNSLRFLNIFCNCSPSTFFLATGLLDRLISIVQVHPQYMASIGTCCFYLAAKTCEPSRNVPNPSELLKLSRCADNLIDFYVTERRILETLRGNAASVTALTFLEYFSEVFRLYFGGVNFESLDLPGSEGVKESGLSEAAFAVLAAKLEVLVCQFEFSQFRGDVLALALLSYDLQERGILCNPDQFALVVELQYYCQISDVEFIQCRGLVIEYLAMYSRQPTKLPRLQLAWSVSRRTLHKMKPSTRASQDLEPILEDVPLSSAPITDDETEDDSGPFDSECDDNDSKLREDGVIDTFDIVVSEWDPSLARIDLNQSKESLSLTSKQCHKSTEHAYQTDEAKSGGFELDGKGTEGWFNVTRIECKGSMPSTVSQPSVGGLENGSSVVLIKDLDYEEIRNKNEISELDADEGFCGSPVEEIDTDKMSASLESNVVIAE